MKSTENQILNQTVSPAVTVTPAKTISILNNKGGVSKTTTEIFWPVCCQP